MHAVRETLKHRWPLIVDFIRYLAERFNEDRGLQTAGALSFTSVLALVPLVAVTVYVLSGFPVFSDLIGKIHHFLFSNFVPATGAVARKYLEQFASKAANLTTVGVIFLFLTALMVMQTIDQAMNDIWRIKIKRRRVTSFLVYWAVLSLGPLLVALSLASTSYLASLPFVKETVGGEVKSALLGILPFVFMVIAFTLLYTLVPNCPVKIRHALTGALAAAVLFEGAKQAFAYYVTQFPTYAVIYGSLAAIPLFLFWIYISWVIALLGAELAYCAGHYQHERGAQDVDIGGLELIAAYRIMGHLVTAQQQGESVGTDRLLDKEPVLNESNLRGVIDELRIHKLVHNTAEGYWCLSRDATTLTLGDVYRALPDALPQNTGPWDPDDPWNRTLAGLLDDANRSLSNILNTPLAQLYGADGPGTGDHAAAPSSASRHDTVP